MNGPRVDRDANRVEHGAEGGQSGMSGGRRPASAARHRSSRAPDLETLGESLDQVRALARAGLEGHQIWAPLLGGGQTGNQSEDLATWAAGCANSPAAPYADAVLAVHKVATAAGASTANLLDALVQGINQAQETDDLRAAALAGPKSSARLLQFLPVLGLALGAAMGANPVAVLTDGGLGTAALVLGLGLILAGRLWTSVLVKGASRVAGADPLVAGVLAAALRAGLPLPAALTAVGQAWPGTVGRQLAVVGTALARGSPWPEAWRLAVRGRSAGTASAADAAPRPSASPPQVQLIQQLERTLWLVWQSGVEAAPLLDGVVRRAQQAERRRLSQAAARLGVHLMLPLGLCYLPAFICLGLMPVVLSFAQALWPAL